MQADAANILILRRVKPDAVASFEEAVRGWIPTSIQHPGHLGVFLLQPGPGSDEHGALLRFQTTEDWERFRSWPPYQKFLADIRPMLVAEPRVETLHGLEAWFTAHGPGAPPRWKMALLTWIGVNVMVFLASRGVGYISDDWAPWIRFLVVNAIVVAGLTWAVMPIFAKLAAPWLRRRTR